MPYSFPLASTIAILDIGGFFNKRALVPVCTFHSSNIHHFPNIFLKHLSRLPSRLSSRSHCTLSLRPVLLLLSPTSTSSTFSSSLIHHQVEQNALRFRYTLVVSCHRPAWMLSYLTIVTLQAFTSNTSCLLFMAWARQYFSTEWKYICVYTHTCLMYMYMTKGMTMARRSLDENSRTAYVTFQARYCSRHPPSPSTSSSSSTSTFSLLTSTLAVHTFLVNSIYHKFPNDYRKSNHLWFHLNLWTWC